MLRNETRWTLVAAHLAAAIASALCARTGSAGDVVIHEIHYEAEENTAREEFIELFNRSAAAVDLSGWLFSEGVRYTFPEGTTIAGHGYLVVAQDPEEIERRFAFADGHGPWEGRLDNDGERIVLRRPDGRLEDAVDYGLAFPWPTASGGDGSSMELIHPSLDNDLGGSWRASGLVSRPPRERAYYLSRSSDGWRYRRGDSPPSEPPSAWRTAEFAEDDSWETGTTSIGFGDDDDATILDDMRGSYSSIYLRREFTVPTGEDEWPDALMIGHFVDDGCVVWINDREVFRLNVADEVTPAFDDTATGVAEARWTEEILPPPANYLRAGNNIVAIHALNRSASSADFSIDIELFAPGDDDFPDDFLGPPTPGAPNSVAAANAPPQVRQVASVPPQPPADADFVITAKVTDPDGVGSVLLHYQVVLPGDYIPARLPLSPSALRAVRSADVELPENPEFEAPESWTTIPMADDGEGVDDRAGDSVYSVRIPGQPNRTILRYRITATDIPGIGARVPYEDDPNLNFATWVYDGVPGYAATRRSVHPDGAGHVYGREEMDSLAVYTLVTRAEYVVEAVAASSGLQIPQGTQARFVENWEGAFVYDGRVYDHISYRLRGANGRYQVPAGNPAGVAGKRHWRFKFLRGNHLRARDRFGRLHPTRWRILNTGRMFGNRLDGNWGLGDQVNDVIWNAYGVPAAHGHAFHFRVVDGPDEAPSDPDGQYLGDFWGIARAFENYDVRFLEAHGLEKGNLYKLVNQTRYALEQLRYQAPDAVDDGRDHDNVERPNYTRTEEWLRAHIHWDEWFRYHSVAQALRHYDYWPEANKNAAWYFEPDYRDENGFLGRMWTLPFDADATWGPTWNAGQDRPYEAIHGGGGKPELQKEYRSHIREVRDLLWQRDQLEPVIRQVASFMDALEEPDIDRWRGAPAAAGRQQFSSARQSTLEGKITDMLAFAFSGGSWPGGNVGAGGRARTLDSLADSRDRSGLPSTPEVEYVGPAEHPIDAIRLRCGPFEDPQGSETFGAMEWRLAEVSSIADPGSRPLSDPIWRQEPVPLELTAIWKSGELATYSPDVTVPPEPMEPGRRYRARVRMRDATGLWSHWSAPVEFEAGEPLAPIPAEEALRVTEIMYHPSGDSGFEYIELRNTGPTALDLSAVRFRDGIEFAFADGDVLALGSGEYVLVVGDRLAFEARYESVPASLIAGEYRGQLSNAGERVLLVWGRDRPILDFTYSDEWYPVTDGAGRSLVPREEAGAPDLWTIPASWRPSHSPLGSPGEEDIDTTAAGGQVAGDIRQTGRLDISDAVGILGHLFRGQPSRLPCGDGTTDDPANVALLDVDGDGSIRLTDAVFVLEYLFRAGPPPAAGVGCFPIPGCPDVCAP